MPPHRSRWRRPLRSRLRRRSPVVWWAVAAALAGTTGLTVDSALARADAQASRFGRLRTVPVATRAVAAGQVVGDDAVRLERRPASLLPAAAPASDPAKRVAVVALLAGEVIVEPKLAPAGRRGAVALLPPGARALAIPGGVGGRPPAGVGDRVDVLATFPEAEEPTVVVAERALVVAVDPEADTVTVAVRRQDAPRVAFALVAGTVTLALAAA
ncbi:MAG: hypothetical protein KY454_02915 [Actinobacteria bacterium]|nr:hypothetical protein [Actinomycetota bacterium]MBW3650628.1 hypothetical protein [Actinomycetota bacterium]